VRQRERVGSRGGDRERESETKREMLSERERDAERERERERETNRENPINGGPAPEEQEATSSFGSLTGGWRSDFRCPESTSGEAVKVRQFLWSGDYI
jgi:hypothetical protein